MRHFSLIPTFSQREKEKKKPSCIFLLLPLGEEAIVTMAGEGKKDFKTVAENIT